MSDPVTPHQAHLNALLSAVSVYTDAPDDTRFAELDTQLVELVSQPFPAEPVLQQTLELLMARAATIEPVWGLLAGLLLWRTGRCEVNDFNNVWGCSRFAGRHSRFSGKTAHAHLALVAQHQVALNQSHTPAAFIIASNAYRELHRYAEAESLLLQGLTRCVDDPFLKFRLVDLWLMTYQHDRAERLLASLRTRYPYALEMMFTLPTGAVQLDTKPVLPAFDAPDSDYIWLVAADTVYTRRFGVKLAQTITDRALTARLQPDPTDSDDVPMARPRVHLHVHVVVEPDAPAPTEVLAAMSSQVPAHFTQRLVDLAGASANQRKALFASERFLCLADMLERYRKPILVTDIDVECLRDPGELLGRLGNADIGFTQFDTVRDAWDRYPATVLLVRATDAAVAFFREMAAMVTSLLHSHPQPWFVDQIALFRLIEGGKTPAKVAFLGPLLTDSQSPHAFFRILHASWENL